MCQAASRRHLFSSQTIWKVVKFHRLLISTPDIAWNILNLNVWVLGYPSRAVNDEGKEISPQKWFASSPLLIDIFGVMYCLEILIPNNLMHLTWDELSSDLRSAIVKLFR
jgi:hypothetical protein